MKLIQTITTIGLLAVISLLAACGEQKPYQKPEPRIVFEKPVLEQKPNGQLYPVFRIIRFYSDAYRVNYKYFMEDLISCGIDLNTVLSITPIINNAKYSYTIGYNVTIKYQ